MSRDKASPDRLQLFISASVAERHIGTETILRMEDLIRDLQLNSINFQEFCFVLGK